MTPQGKEHAVEILLPGRGEHENGPRAVPAVQELREPLDAGRVVGAVEQQPGLPRDPLQPSRPSRGLEARRHRVGIRSPPQQVEEDLQGPDGHGGVLGLMAAGQRRTQVAIGSDRGDDVESFPSHHDLGLLAGIDPGCVTLAGEPAKDLPGPLLHDPRDHRCVRPDDAALLERDRLEGGAEGFHVVVVHRDDHGEVTSRGVRRVEPSAHTHLEDRDVDAGLAKGGQGGGGDRLEEGRMCLELPAIEPGLELGPQMPQQMKQRVVVHVGAVDPDPLVGSDEVRRAEHPAPHAVATEHRLEHGADRALAVGAPDRDPAVVALRVVEALEQRPDVLQAQLHPELLKPVEPFDRFRGHRFLPVEGPPTAAYHSAAVRREVPAPATATGPRPRSRGRR